MATKDTIALHHLPAPAPAAPAVGTTIDTEGEVPINADFLALDKERVETAGQLKVPIQPRPNVKDCSQQDGLNAELRFQKWARKTWPTAHVRTSCSHDNKQQHWDVLLQSPEALRSSQPAGVRVDVKAARKRNRHDAHVSAQHTWIELQSANIEFKGSLFGDAEMFAFECADGEWLLVARHHLAQLIMNMLMLGGMQITTDKVTATAPRPKKNAPFMIYNRRDAERLLWFPMSIIKKLAWSPAAYENLHDMEVAFQKVKEQQKALATMSVSL